MTFIYAPQLKTMNITVLNKIKFGCPRLAQFINRTSTLSAPDEAHVQFDNNTAVVKLRYQTSTSSAYNFLILSVGYISNPLTLRDLQLSSIG